MNIFFIESYHLAMRSIVAGDGQCSLFSIR